MDKIQEAFEKNIQEVFGDNDDMIDSLEMNNFRAMHRAGYKSRDEEIKKLREAMEKVKVRSIEKAMITNDGAWSEINYYCTEALKEINNDIK